MSHPLRVRGLKHLCGMYRLMVKCRRILYGCVDWNITTYIINSVCPEVASFTGAWIETIVYLFNYIIIYVASFTGAWIETTYRTRCKSNQGSHPLRVRGLKPISVNRGYTAWSRILYGCVDWNNNSSLLMVVQFCRILYGCVDWNIPNNLIG